KRATFVEGCAAPRLRFEDYAAACKNPEFFLGTLPKDSGGQAGSFCHRFEFSPHYGWMNTPVEFFLRKAAVGSSDDVFAADTFGKPSNPLGHKFGVFDDIGAMTDHARNQNLAWGKFHVFPDLPLVFVPRIGRFNKVRTRANFQDEIDDLAQGNVGSVRSRPTAPTDVISHTVFRDSLKGVVQQLNVTGEPTMVVIE